MGQASADAKIAFTSQLYELENRASSGGISPDAGYTQAGSALVDLKQYDDWASSFLGPALGGWESRNNLINRFAVLQTKFLNQMGQTSGQVSKTKADQVIKDTPTSQAMTAATCDTNPAQAAIDTLGPFWGRFPGAEIYACKKSQAILIGSIVGGLLLLIVLSPYANILSKVIGKRRKRK